MKNKFEKRVNYLTAYAVLSTLVFGTVLLSSFDNKDKNENFDEITVKKINLIAEDGGLRMVLSNEKRQHSGRANSKDWPKRERPAGIIFFNTSGDECGGLVYKSSTKEGKTKSGMSFTMDQFNDDQVIQILNDEYFDNAKSSVERGISINEYPVGSNIDVRNKKLEELEKIVDEKERKTNIRNYIQAEGSKRRLFIGRTRGNSSGLFLAGPDGKPKMMIYVDDKGNPKIETFDNEGNVKNYLDITTNAK